nr:PREDICTED: uncharacterized protein C7orf43 homolog [Struthio camelus australis]
MPVEDPIVSTDEVIFPLTISLDKLPPGTVKAKVSHHSGEVPVGAFCRVASAGSACPCALSALEEHNFLFQLQAPERPPEDAKEGLEVPLVAVIQWSTPKLPFTSSIYTHYRLPSIRLERPRFVMTAAREAPEGAQGGGHGGGTRDGAHGTVHGVRHMVVAHEMWDMTVTHGMGDMVVAHGMGDIGWHMQ